MTSSRHQIARGSSSRMQCSRGSSNCVWTFVHLQSKWHDCRRVPIVVIPTTSDIPSAAAQHAICCFKLCTQHDMNMFMSCNSGPTHLGSTAVGLVVARDAFGSVLPYIRQFDPANTIVAGNLECAGGPAWPAVAINWLQYCKQLGQPYNWAIHDKDFRNTQCTAAMQQTLACRSDNRPTHSATLTPEPLIVEAFIAGASI